MSYVCPHYNTALTLGKMDYKPNGAHELLTFPLNTGKFPLMSPDGPSLPANSPGKRLFTPANAREMAARSHEAQRQRKALAITLASTEEPIPQPAEDGYRQKRIARVRKQIELLSDYLDDESDPQKLDRLASAIYRLCELERVLSARPLPGSLKPSAARSRRQSSSFAPVEPDPPASQ